ncbi:hypothetical protein PINS_up023127 [Pythium insidiosum]|nr:hypothetical protein PINS_up023127 [Pythium insidiosum]
MASRAARVVCSLDELRQLRGKAIKFSLAHSSARSATTAFVFLCERTLEPRAFVNRCPHARLELDLDDSDFFADGFLQCKAHGAFFDPSTGICLQGPAATRRRAHAPTTVGALPRLRVWVENGDVVVSETADKDGDTTLDSDDLAAYRAQRQAELAAKLAARHDDVLAMQNVVQRKAMERMRRYAEDAGARRSTRRNDPSDTA